MTQGIMLGCEAGNTSTTASSMASSSNRALHACLTPQPGALERPQVPDSKGLPAPQLAGLCDGGGRVGQRLGQQGAGITSAGLRGAGLHRLPQSLKVGGGTGEAGGVCGDEELTGGATVQCRDPWRGLAVLHGAPHAQLAAMGWAMRRMRRCMAHQRTG